MTLIRQTSLLIGSAGDTGVSGSLMPMFPSDTRNIRSFIRDSKVLILTCTSALHPASCTSLVSPSIAEKMLLFQHFVKRGQMKQLSDWAGFVVSVIKVLRNRRGIHLAGIRSLENILFGVKWARLMSQQKQAVFVDVSRHREERRVSNDKRPFDTACLSNAVLFAHTCCMQNQQWAEVAVVPRYSSWFLLFFF